MEKINYFQIEFKDVEIKGEVIKIKGYASTPTIDRYNDIVDPKAFSNSIIEYMKNPVILLQHDGNKLIGKATDYKINFKGLEVEVELSNNIDNVFENIQSGILKGFSIGYIPTKWEYIEENGVEIRKINGLDLIEISVVSTPANKESLFTMAKSIKSFFNNLTNENMKTKEIKEEIIEEIKTDVVEEIVDGKNDDVIIEGTNTLDEVEKASENLVVPVEVATETIENIAEVVEEVVKDESNEAVKEINLLKEEVKELKENMLEIVEILSKTIQEQKEVKSIVNKIPVRKGLITIGEEKKSDLSTKIDNMRKSNFTI